MLTIDDLIERFDGSLAYSTNSKEICQYIADLLKELKERRKAPEIVRCGECKHRDPEDKKCDCGHDIIWQLPRDDDWYCADAEKENRMSELIERQAAIDTVHAIPDFEETEKVIIDNLYVGDKKVTDLIASGRLRLVGFCKECKHCFPPLVCRVNGEVVQVTSDRCSICNGYVEKNGWCYKFERRTNGQG